MTQRWKGLGVSPGVALGRVHLVDRRRVSVPHYHVPVERRAQELDRLENAIVLSEKQFAELRRKASENNLREVDMLLEAHALILRDESFRTAMRDRIQNDGLNAEWALKDVVRKIKQLFDGLDEDYFRERRSDVDVVGDRLLRNLVGAEVDLLSNLSEDAVVVAYDLSPADTVALAKYAVKAFVVETGGRTSHTAILARALKVPSVLGVQGIMDVAGSGDEIMVDGNRGEVVLGPTRALQGRFFGAERRRLKEEQALLADRDLPAVTRDGAEVHLYGNIEVVQEIESVLSHGGLGVGLYRTEFLIIEDPRIYSAVDHYAAYSKLVDALGGRELTIRTVDIGGDKFLKRGSPRADNGGDTTPPLHNPALGLRAIRLSLHDRPRFKEQLKGILLASGHGPVRILLPFVTGVEELLAARGVVEEAKTELARAGMAFDDKTPLGVMIETPGAALIADILAKEADFLAIGTNDLIQYALAIDRANEAVSYLYRPCHPAVLRMVQSVRIAAEQAKKPVSVCGEMAGDTFHLPLLLGLGIRTLSMTATSIPLVKRLVRRVAAAECEALAAYALSLPTAAAVEALVVQQLREWSPELFGKAKAPRA